MDFHSFQFLLFFAVVTLGFFVLPFRCRPIWLLSASCYFYVQFLPLYILVLGFTIVVDYFAGLWLERTRGPRRTAVLALSIAANVSVLALFKYAVFLTDNWNWLGARIGWGAVDWQSSLVLPIGLSFHTFQAMSYTIEVYRGHVPAERSFIQYALYVMFFPQLVAGPIERPQNVLPQLHRQHTFDYERVLSGLTLVAFGFFKKVVIADRLAPMVEIIYRNPQQYIGAPLLAATVCFALQIYCDFSGYSDIAQGSARVLGIHLMTNFRRPYFASSPAEFWTRWHISLSTWFRDYVYIPLGGNRRFWVRNILLTFLLSGLWHGAAWTYVAWGGLNGLLLLAQGPGRRWPALPGWLLTNAGILVTWVFFRARTFADAAHVLTHWWWSPQQSLQRVWASRMGASAYDAHVLAASLLLLLGLELWEERRGERWTDSVLRCPGWLRYLACYALVAYIMVFGKMNSLQQFIYFQF